MDIIIACRDLCQPYNSTRKTRFLENKHDTSHCIPYVKLQSLRDTPKYNAIIKLYAQILFIMIGTTSKGGTVELVTFIFPHWLRATLIHIYIYIYIYIYRLSIYT